MRQAVSCCASLAVMLVFPAVAFPSTISVKNHTQPNSSGYGGGAPIFQHADFNGDGMEDLVFAYHPEQGNQDSFAVQLATGNGAYAAAVGYELPPEGSSGSNDANSIVLGDFTNDGNIDILVFGALNAYLYVNNGKGAFTLRNTIPFGDSTHGLAQGVAADLNHDNLTDVVFVSNGLLYVWFGKGDGTFTPGPAMSVHGVNPMVGDFDGDGKADILLPDDVNYALAYVLYGDGRGNFPETKTIDMTPSTATNSSEDGVNFTVGDANSDGRSDVLATQPLVSKNRVFIFYGDVARSFASRTSVAVGRCLAGPAQTADLDGNGYNDLIVEEASCSNRSAGSLYIDVLTRNANASYNADQTIYWAQPVDGVIYGIPYAPDVLRADLNTKPDLLVTQCADSRCDAYTITTQINTTAGGVHTCDAPAAAKGINVCSPTTAVYSPVPFAIGASGTQPMRDVEVWIDGSKRAEQIDGFSNYTFLNKGVSLNPGTHNVTVFGAGWDQSLVKKSFTVTVK